MAPEDIREKYSLISTFDERATNPLTVQDSQVPLFMNMGSLPSKMAPQSSSATKPQSAAASPSPSTSTLGNYSDAEDSEVIKKAKMEKIDPSTYVYDERDVALYNLGIGATEKELTYTFEGADEFQALPTFGVIPSLASSASASLDFLPNFSPNMLLHGEQYLAIKAKIPTSGTLVSETKLLEVLDKGKAASVTTISHTRNKKTGEVIFENQSTVFIRGSGGFGGRKNGKDRGAATAENKPPSRQADKVVEEKTEEKQAAMYRLSGDYNPLHIDPEFAKVGGFPKPILHGLCFFGIAGKNVLKQFGPFKDIKARFTGVVIPGQTLVTSMWKESNKVVFDVKVKETGKYCLQAAAVTLV